MQQRLHPAIDVAGALRAASRPVETKLPSWATNLSFFAMGRDALRVLAEARFRPMGATVWVPSYQCLQMVVPFEEAGVPLRFYEVREDLTIDWDALFDAVSAAAGPQALLVPDYFGYPQPFPDDVLARVEATFAYVIRDCAHALPSEALRPPRGQQGSCALYTLRKPLPVAALAVIAETQVPEGAAPITDAAPQTRRGLFTWYEIATNAVPSLQDTAWYGPRRALVKAMERLGGLPSPVAFELASRLDWRAAARARRANAVRLTEGLRRYAFHAVVPPETCPYYFPIRHPNPKALKARLRLRGVETTDFWSYDESRLRDGFSVARRLCATTLCLPVHQGLRPADVDAIVDAVHDADRSS
ncbi:MAG: hypothetical protein FJX78_03385 [Armatimonadetes bacterium]|nr:hypothetical protein [Armatimonadota bacterium]